MRDLFKKISAIAVLAALVFTFASCLDNKPYETDKPLVIITDAETDKPLTVITDAETTGVATAAETTAAETTAAETTAPETTKAETTAETAKAETTKAETTKAETTAPEPTLDKNGWYSSKDEVALYIHLYGKLPGNFITKAEAQKLGWTGGGLDKYAKGKSIGGDSFGNFEGRLPKAKGRKYTECDIDTAGAKSRGAKRIVFSNDGLIFYTDDHYETFTQLY